jgi:hypothetical protein
MKCGMEIDHSMLRIVYKLLLVCQQLKMETIYSFRLYPADLTYTKSVFKLVLYTNKIKQKQYTLHWIELRI